MFAIKANERTLVWVNEGRSEIGAGKQRCKFALRRSNDIQYDGAL